MIIVIRESFEFPCKNDHKSLELAEAGVNKCDDVRANRDRHIITNRWHINYYEELEKLNLALDTNLSSVLPSCLKLPK